MVKVSLYDLIVYINISYLHFKISIILHNTVKRTLIRRRFFMKKKKLKITSQEDV